MYFVWYPILHVCVEPEALFREMLCFIFCARQIIRENLSLCKLCMESRITNACKIC